MSVVSPNSSVGSVPTRSLPVLLSSGRRGGASLGYGRYISKVGERKDNETTSGPSHVTPNQGRSPPQGADPLLQPELFFQSLPPAASYSALRAS